MRAELCLPYHTTESGLGLTYPYRFLSDTDLRGMADELFPILLACGECERSGWADKGELIEKVRAANTGKRVAVAGAECPSCGGSGHDPKVRVMLFRALDFDLASDAEFDAIARQKGYVRLDVDVEALRDAVDDYEGWETLDGDDQALMVALATVYLNALGGSDE